MIKALFTAALCLFILPKLTAQPNIERGATSSQIQKRGYVNCGVSQALAGFSTVDDQGQ